MRKAAFGVILLMLLGGVPAALAAPAENEKLTARSFQFKFRDASRAASVIKPLISASGSVSIQPSSNTLVVTDSPAVLREVVRAIQQYDAPPKAFTVEVRLVAASQVRGTPPAVPEDLREISAKLSGVLRFNRFDKLGEIRAQAREGEPVLANLDGAYRADFTMGEFDPISQTLQLSEFRVMRIPPGDGELQQVFRNSTLNLRVGQTVVLGASRLPDSNRILMIVLTAQ
jgi:hypothetical protein